jgi:hypothetical protein
LQLLLLLLEPLLLTKHILLQLHKLLHLLHAGRWFRRRSSVGRRMRLLLQDGSKELICH